jgi:hypothetical protein
LKVMASVLLGKANRIRDDGLCFLRAGSPIVKQRAIFGQSVRVRVRVTLQLTVSQSVSLGVEPNLGLLTRDITSLFFVFCF